jgi:hypothetical protein
MINKPTPPTLTPPTTSTHQIRDYMVDDLKLDPLVSDLSTAFGVPMFMQVFSTPFHVLALDRSVYTYIV